MDEKKAPRTRRAADELGRRVLDEHEQFDIIFEEKLHLHGCQLVEWGPGAVVVRNEAGKFLVPWQSVKYVVLQEKQDLVTRPVLFLEPREQRRRSRNKPQNGAESSEE